ncbi:MAG: DUF3592 domain-containing protein [Bacilli bacterium]|nr:DUF3592 domain-containing protein [Bacilli bacterium]
MHINFSTGRTVQAKPMKPWQGVLFGLIFVIVGIALLCFAVSSIKTYNEKNENFVETTSKVVDYKYNDEGLQAIVVEYVVNGQTYQKVSNSYSNMPKSIGTEVSVKYNPNNPQDAIWTSDSTNIILPIFGALFTLVGVIAVISSIKKGKTQKMIEDQTVEQTNGLYSNIDVQPQMNNINPQVAQQMNNINQPQSNTYNQQVAQTMNNVGQSQMNNINQPNSSVDINNQNNNINTNM